MKTSLISHLEDEKEIEEFEYLVSVSKPVLERLYTILNSEREGVFKKSRKSDNYNIQNWAMYQADFIGSDRTYEKCLTTIKDFLEA